MGSHSGQPVPQNSLEAPLTVSWDEFYPPATSTILSQAMSDSHHSPPNPLALNRWSTQGEK